MSCCTSTTRPTASTADLPGDPVWRMAPGLRKPRLCPASAASGFGCVSPGPPRRKPHLTRNVHGSHPSMHVFSLGRFCARPFFPCEVVASRDAFSSRSGSKPCSPDAVLPDVTRHGSFVSASPDQCRPISLLPEEKMPSFARRMPWKRLPPLRRRRSRTASCVTSCFQSSMLLHNLSSVFSLGKKASQRALRSSRVLLRTIATAHPAAATPHHAAPQPVNPDHAAPRPACPAPAPFPAAAGFPQTFHRVFHISADFPQRLSFPLAFLERDRVRSSESWVLPAA